MKMSFCLLWLSTSLLTAIACGCGQVGGPNRPAADGSIDSAHIDDAPIDGAPIDGALGAKDNPARTCAELRVAGVPSGAYWLRDPAGQSPPFEVYCEQQINGGGWAMLENSVRRDDGTTTAFWQFGYADRLKQRGTPAADQNYYNGALYLIGTEYMDVFVDLEDKTQVAALMTATGFDASTMQFIMPTKTGGNVDVFESQFAHGWSAVDFDGDAAPAPGPAGNCAAIYEKIAQHYTNCWAYNLGADADAPKLDGGVGPHVNNGVLTALGLKLQPVGNYSQVKRIARFTRW